MSEITQEDVNNYLLKYGEGGKKIVETLARLHQIKEAWETRVGQDILSDATNRMSELLDKIVDDKATVSEVAEFRALKNITVRWARKIIAYETHINEIAKGGKEDG